MPATIVEKPFLLDFAHNAVSIKLSGTPLAVNGRKAVTRYQIHTMPRAYYILALHYGTKTYNFSIRTSTTALTNPLEIYAYSNFEQIKRELEIKIAQNYGISRDFEVRVSDTLEITFTARQYGGNNVTLQSNDTSASILLLSQITGLERVEKTGYKIFGKLEVMRIVSGTANIIQTSEILLHTNTSNRALLPLTLLRSYFAAVDIPAYNENFAAYPLKYVLLAYRLAYSDYFDDLVQVIKYSDWQYLVNGKLLESRRALNLPDWNCIMGGNSKLSNFVRPRSYGSPSGLSIKSYLDLPQYAYFMLFSNSGSESSLEIRVDVLNEDGSEILDINPGTVTLSNFSIVRIPLSAKALSLHNHSTQILRYTVRIYHTATPTSVWIRTYIIQEKPFHAKEFLLQNKYGVLESFFVDNEMIEKTVEGEKVICDGKTDIDITDVATTYTARTGYKSDVEMNLLAEAIENRFHYKIVNGSYIPITILPDTLTIIDEEEDLQSAEFQYVFNIPEKTSNKFPIAIEATFEEALWVENERMWIDESIFITKSNDIKKEIYG